MQDGPKLKVLFLRNPHAVKVMAEAGVDISGQRSKHVDELGRDFDCVIVESLSDALVKE